MTSFIYRAIPTIMTIITCLVGLIFGSILGYASTNILVKLTISDQALSHLMAGSFVFGLAMLSALIVFSSMRTLMTVIWNGNGTRIAISTGGVAGCSAPFQNAG